MGMATWGVGGVEKGVWQLGMGGRKRGYGNLRGRGRRKRGYGNLSGNGDAEKGV